MSGRLSRNTVILLTSNVVTALLAFGLTALIARGLGDVGLGRYAAIMAWIMPLTLLADLGINTLITRDVAQDHSLTSSYLDLALCWRWIIGGGLVLLVILIAPLLSSDVAIIGGLRIAVFLVMIDAAFGTYTALWRAWETMLPILVLNALYLMMQIIGTALAVKFNLGLHGVLFALVIADALQLLLTWLWWRRWHVRVEQENPLTLPFPRKQGKEILSSASGGESERGSAGEEQMAHEVKSFSTREEGFRMRFLSRAAPFALAGILAAIQLRLIFVLLERLTEPQVIGWFAAANRFIEAAKMPPFALFGALFPVLATLIESPERFKKLSRTISLSLAAYGMAVAVSISILSPFLVALVFGDEFKNAIPLLQLMGWSLIPLLLRQHLTLLYYARHQEQHINGIMLAFIPLRILLGFFLIQRFGGIGGAWTVLLTEIAFFLVLWSGSVRWWWLIPALLGLLALNLYQFRLQNTSFDGLYGQDAFAYYNYGLDVKQAIIEQRLPGQMYWGLGFPSLLGLGFMFFPATPETAQVIVMLTGALTVALTFLLTLDLARLMNWTEKQGIIAATIAGLVILFCGQLIQSSIVIMADAPGIFGAVLSAYGLVRFARTHRLEWLILASSTLAFAAMTRWIFGLLAIPFALFYLMHWRLISRETLFAGLATAFVFLPQLIVSTANPDPLVHHAWLEGWSPANAFQRNFVNVDGTFHYDHSIAHFYISALSDKFYLHWLLLPFLIYGAALILWKHRAAAVLLIGWFGVTYGFLAGIPYQNIRFSLAFFLPIAIVISFGLAHLLEYLKEIPMLRVTADISISIMLIISFHSTFSAGRTNAQTLIQRKQTELEAVTWIQQQISEPDATIYMLDLWLMMEHYADTLNVRQIYYETPDSLSQVVPQQTATYLFLNTWQLNRQWKGKSPWIAYQWFETEYGLTHIGQYGNYHLLRVNRRTG